MDKILIVIISLGFISCGYQWGNRNEHLPGNYKEIAVPVFKNSTKEVGAEVYFTNAMIEEIIRSPANTVTTQHNAEVVLEGEVVNMDVVGEGLANLTKQEPGTELVSTYKMNVSIRLQVRRKADQKILWSTDLAGEKTFASAKIGAYPFNSANPIYNQSAIHANLQNIAKDLMAQAYSQMTESF